MISQDHPRFYTASKLAYIVLQARLVLVTATVAAMLLYSHIQAHEDKGWPLTDVSVSCQSTRWHLSGLCAASRAPTHFLGKISMTFPGSAYNFHGAF